MGAENAGAGRPPPSDRCKNNDKTGHWAKDCRRKKKDVAHVAQAKDEEGALMYIIAETEVTTPPKSPSLPRPAPPTVDPQTRVHLDKRKVLLYLNSEEEEAVGPRRWVLNTGVTNHMMGSWNVLAELNTSVTGTIKFGDGSVVTIEGKGLRLQVRGTSSP